MIPSSSHAALLLLVVSFCALGSWANTFKATGSRWRFEWYSLDFSIGALLVGIVAAYTLGTIGGELSFSDRMLVAGYTKQAWELAGGVFFNVGNMLLLAAVSLLGLAAAFPLSIATALIVAALVNIRGHHSWLLAAGALVMLLAVYSIRKAFGALYQAIAIKPGTEVKTDARFRSKTPAQRGRRGMWIAILSGVPFGLVYGMISSSMQGDFGVGPYAGLLLFASGMVISTLFLNIFFLNVAITGPMSSHRPYRSGTMKQHLLGLLGGIIWAVGMLALFIAIYMLPQIELSPVIACVLPLASVLLMVFWGWAVWKEFPGEAVGARSALALGGLSYACGLVLLGFGFGR